MKKGDIVLIPFPFTDLSGSKNRPALVLVGGEVDVTLAFISTQLKWKEDTDVLLKPTKENGLKIESVVRHSKLATIDTELAIGRLGRIDSKTREQVNKNIIKILKLDE